MPTLTLLLTGDVMTGRGVDQILPHPCPPHIHESYLTSALDYVALAERANGPIPRPVGFDYVWGDALGVLDRVRPDARVVNLETSVTVSEDAAPKGINYRMSPANVEVLTHASIDCCVLANNHVLDWGRAGLVETIETLRAARIRIAGAGRTGTEAREPAVLDFGDGRRVLVFAFAADDCGVPVSWSAGPASPGVHYLPDLSARTAAAISGLMDAYRRPGDLVVASVHWGANWGYAIPRRHRSFARRLIDDAGVDVVHGHSSHHPKGIEVHRDRPIFYGCGDLLNDYEGIGGYEEFGDVALLYFPEFDMPGGRLRSLEMVPVQVRNFQLRAPAPADRVRFGETFARECARFGHGITLGTEGWRLEW